MLNLIMVLCLYDIKIIYIVSFVLNLLIYKYEDEIINILFLFCLEQVYSFDQMYWLFVDIGILDINSFILEYRNGGDIMFFFVMVFWVFLGFWVKYLGNLLYRYMGFFDGFLGFLRFLG